MTQSCSTCKRLWRFSEPITAQGRERAGACIANFGAYTRAPLVAEAVVSAPGGDPSNHDNIMIGTQGTGKAYTLARLEREAPELHARVVDGELSANAAAIEAGFRKKPSAFEQIQKLIPKLSAKERRALRQMLET